jgi:hypothetical protein
MVSVRCVCVKMLEIQVCVALSALVAGSLSEEGALHCEHAWGWMLDYNALSPQCITQLLIQCNQSTVVYLFHRKMFPRRKWRQSRGMAVIDVCSDMSYVVVSTTA